MSARNYDELCIIGRGAYGTVYKARDMLNNRIVALKRVSIMNNTDEKGVPVSTLREITLLKQLDNMSHPNIVRMFDAFQTFSTATGSTESTPRDMILTIVFEHVEEDLSTFLHKSQPYGLSENLVKNLMYQLLSGVDYLHTNRMIHRDIKPQNILIANKKQVKIADFGLARVYGFCKLVTSVVVTLWYRAPEILLRAPYAMMVDLWSVGAIMAEMYNRTPLFRGKSDVNQLHNILSIIGSPEKAEWPEQVSLSWDSFNNYPLGDLKKIIINASMEGIDLVSKLLVFDPNKRLNAKKCLQHSYFDNIKVPEAGDQETTRNFKVDVHCKKKTHSNSLLTPNVFDEEIPCNDSNREVNDCELILPYVGQDVCGNDRLSRGSDSGLEMARNEKEGNHSEIDKLNASFHETSFNESPVKKKTFANEALTLGASSRSPNIQSDRTLTRSDSGIGVSPQRGCSFESQPTRSDSGIGLSPQFICLFSEKKTYEAPNEISQYSVCLDKKPYTLKTNKHEQTYSETEICPDAQNKQNVLEEYGSYMLDKENICAVKKVNTLLEKRHPCEDKVEKGDATETINYVPPTKRLREDETQA